MVQQVNAGDVRFSRVAILFAHLLNAAGANAYRWDAANNVHKLENAGILQEVTGRKRNQVFVAQEILRFLYDRPQAETPAPN